MNALLVGCVGLVTLIVGVVLFGAVVGFGFLGGNSPVLTDNLSAPLNGATMAKVDINTASGNLTIDRLAGGEQLLASGTLEYRGNQSVPIRTVSSSDGQASLTLKAETARQAWLRLPWDACNGATTWQIHLNPTVSSDITAHSGGGNVKLNLAGMIITRLMADTGGGNVDVVLPDNASNVNVVARTGGGSVTVEIGSGIQGTNVVNAESGGGNVLVRVPSGIAAKISATSGFGKVILDSRFAKLDSNTYQSSDYDSAANKVDITARSGAGNVTIDSN